MGHYHCSEEEISGREELRKMDMYVMAAQPPSVESGFESSKEYQQHRGFVQSGRLSTASRFLVVFYGVSKHVDSKCKNFCLLEDIFKTIGYVNIWLSY